MAAKARARKVRRQHKSLPAVSAFAQKNGARLTVTAANPIPSDRRSSKPAAVWPSL